MKKIISLIAFLTVISVNGADYSLEKSHSRMGFKISHLVITSVYGNFKSLDGSFQYDEKKGTLSNFKVKLDPASINTEDAKRDDHLKGKDFFSVKEFPELTFSSDEVIKAKKNGAKLKGKLTMHGVTKEVVLIVKFNGVKSDPWGNSRMGLEIRGKINRRDFGMNWNKALDGGGVLVGDEVEILVDVEAVPSKK